MPKGNDTNSGRGATGAGGELSDAALKQLGELERVWEARRGFLVANANDNVQQTRQKVEDGKKKLISDVKKTTGFVKKVRALQDDNRYACLLFSLSVALVFPSFNIRVVLSRCCARLSDVSLKLN